MRAKPTVTCFLQVGVLGVLAATAPAACVSDEGLPLRFLAASDVSDPYGKLQPRSQPLEYVQALQFDGPRPLLLEVEKRPDGQWWLYGVDSEQRNGIVAWRIVRYRTRDGRELDGPEVLHREEGVGWLGSSAMARNPSTGRMVLLRTRYQHEDTRGLQVWAFTSEDGQHWRKAQDRPAYHDHDALGLGFNPDTGRFISYQTTYQPWHKHIPDNIRDTVRRVLSIRTSEDGVAWTPDYQVGFHRTGPYAPERFLIVPDENDPPDIEFYRLAAFRLDEHTVGMMLNYAPSPKAVNPVSINAPGHNGHGPFMSGEWWISRDGLQWSRPYQGQDCLGDASHIVTHPPIRIGGDFLFIISGHLYRIADERIGGIYSKANAEFTTRTFEMPDAGLLLNANVASRHVPAPEPFCAHAQGYIMVEIQDESGRPIPGFERDKAIVLDQDSRAIPLEWNGQDGTAIAGRKVRLRLFFRDSTIYGVAAGGGQTALAPPAAGHAE